MTLCIIKIGRHGNHHPLQLATEGLLGAMFEHAQNIRGDFDRAKVTTGGVKTRYGGVGLYKFVRQACAKMFDIRESTPHEAFDRDDGIQWVLRRHGLGLVADNRNLPGLIMHH